MPYCVARPSGVVHDARSLSIDEASILGIEGGAVSGVEEVLYLPDVRRLLT